MPAGLSERVDFLRAKIASLETVGGASTPDRSWNAGIRQGARVGLGDAQELCSIDRALQAGLERGALHEVVAARPAARTAASGFAFALAARFAGASAKTRAAIVWIVEAKAARETGALYGPGLALLGLDPSRLVLVETRDAQESLWAMEEALKCRSPAAVIGEIWGLAKIYDLAASRRLLLAARKSATPGLLVAAGLAGEAEHLSSGAGTRFEIGTSASPHLASAGGRLPMPGKTVWAVRLVKARAGPQGFGFDRDKVHPLTWDPQKACFRDALSFAVPSVSLDRPARAAGGFSTRGDCTLHDLHEGQIGAAPRFARSLRAGTGS
jgi:protein ImuA